MEPLVGDANVLKYTINKPVWNTQSVGVATKRLVSGTTMEIDIDYKDASGQLVYPYKYRMACSKMKQYPTQSVKGTVLHIIPIADFEAVG